jgi:hypothetical protein
VSGMHHYWRQNIGFSPVNMYGKIIFNCGH